MISIQAIYGSQRLALKYFTLSVALFGVMIVFGLLAAADYVNPHFLFPTLPFSMLKIMHIDVLIIWLLTAFLGALLWLLPAVVAKDNCSSMLMQKLYHRVLRCAILDRAQRRATPFILLSAPAWTRRVW